MSYCFRTGLIYRSIYLGDLETKKLSHGEREVARKLRHCGKTRHKRGEEDRRGKIRISHPISERPKEALDRSEIGHCETGTVLGPIHTKNSPVKLLRF